MIISTSDEAIELLTRRAYEVRMLEEVDNDNIFQWKWSELDEIEKEIRREFVRDLVNTINYLAANGELSDEAV